MFLNSKISFQDLAVGFENFFSLDSIAKKDIHDFFSFQEQYFNLEQNNTVQSEYQKKIFNSYQCLKRNLKERLTQIHTFEIDISALYKYDSKYNLTVYLDKAIDIMNLIDIPNKQNSLLSDYIHDLAELFLFQEILFYICLNMSMIEKNNDGFIIHPIDEMKKSLRRRVFTFTFDTQSYSTDKIIFNAKSKIFFSNCKKEIKHDIVKRLTNLLIDKVFFLQLDYIKSSIDKKDAVTIQMLCRFFSILLMANEKNEKISWDSTLFESYKISSNFLNDIRCIHEQISYLDQGFTIFNNHLIINTEADIYSVISQYAKYLKSFSQNFKTNLSNAFEEAYVFEYLHKNSSTYYEVYQGINPKIQPYEKIDIDVILRDKFSGHFYFIQVKYTFRQRLAYLEEELKLVLKNKKLLQKGISQLTETHQYLEEPIIQSLLNKVGVYGANHTNTHFILLHNITSFDFTQIGNYAVYEWNSFRNIVQRGKLNRTDTYGNVLSPIQFKENLQIENVDHVIDKYSSRTDYSNYAVIWENFITTPIIINKNITSYIR